MPNEYYCPFTRVVVSARTRLFGEVAATIKCELEQRDWLAQQLLKVRIDFSSGPLRGCYVDLPPQALRDAGAVLMNSWEFRDAEPRRTKGCHLYLVCRAPHHLADGQRADKTLHFRITDGIFGGLSIDVPVSEEGSRAETFNYDVYGA